MILEHAQARVQEHLLPGVLLVIHLLVERERGVHDVAEVHAIGVCEREILLAVVDRQVAVRQRHIAALGNHAIKHFIGQLVCRHGVAHAVERDLGALAVAGGIQRVVRRVRRICRVGAGIG